MTIKKIKISKLPLAQSLKGLSTIGVDSENKSVKVGLEFVKTAADNANSAADNANTKLSLVEEKISSLEHNDLPRRDVEDCHPVESITGLSGILSLIELFYGVERDLSFPNPRWKRIGNDLLHKKLTIHNSRKRFLHRDNGTVNYYTHQNNTNLKEDGTPAILNGTDGQVMVSTMSYYRRFETEGTIQRVMISEFPLEGFHKVEEDISGAYLGAYDRSIANAPKLCSVVNNTPEFRGGNNNAAWDAESRTLLQRPVTVDSVTGFRNAARRRGPNWNAAIYESYKNLIWLYIIEYANSDARLPFTNELDANGFKQGGLGQGVTMMSGISAYNGGYPIIPCGITNSLGNRTGVVPYNMPDNFAGNPKVVYVPSYRGVELPFGDISVWLDGCLAVGGTEPMSTLYVNPNPVTFGSTNLNDYENRGQMSNSISGYVEELTFGEKGEITPSKLNINGFPDLFFAAFGYGIGAYGNTVQRNISMGSTSAANPIPSVNAGGFFNFDSSTGSGRAHIGTRLCYLK